MDVFEWNCDFETGLYDVDEQHHRLVDIINSLGYLLSHDNATSKNLENVFTELISYTQYHFDEEEKSMELCGLDKEYICAHKEVHHVFLQDVLDFKKEIDFGKEETPKSLFDFLMNWLVYHIMGADMSMARQMEAVKKGLSPQEAFAIEGRRKESSAAMLLNSLNNLFEQLSEKNRKLKELNHNLEEKVKERTRELSLANERLHMLATTDTLTGLANRRKAMDSLQLFWDETRVNASSLSCIMIDADNFKHINDSYGHDAGDMVLKALSLTIQETVRTDDIVCRLGGDEFLVICPLTDEEGVMTIATILHRQVGKLKVQAGVGIWYGSISVGIATKTQEMQTINDLIKQADLAVYAAKKAGKNCVRQAEVFVE